MKNDFTRLMIDTAKGSVAQYSTDERNEAIRKHFAEVLGISEDTKGRELRRAVRRNKVALFEIIEDTVDEMLVSGWGDNPFFAAYVEQRNLALGDMNSFYVPDNSLLTVSKFSGGTHDLVRQKLGMGSEYAVTTSWYGVKIYEEFERFQAGRIDWAGFINKMYEAFDKKINDMLYKAFIGVDTVIPAAYGLKDTTLTAEGVLDIVEKVATATGRDVVITGTRTSLSALANKTEAGWISDKMKDERNTTGTVGSFEGVDTMVVPQVFEQNTRHFMVPEKKLYIMPKTDNKFIKLVYEGDMMYNEVSDGTTNVDATIEGELQAKLGVATVLGLDFGVVTF